MSWVVGHNKAKPKHSKRDIFMLTFMIYVPLTTSAHAFVTGTRVDGAFV